MSRDQLALVLFDITVMIAVPETILRQRLTQRWRSYSLSPDEIAAKVDSNDLLNARLVAASSAVAEFVFNS